MITRALLDDAAALLDAIRAKQVKLERGSDGC
jgi:hypothetical protein